MEEIWKDVAGYEGTYFVSNLGNVKNKREKIMRQYLMPTGYYRINFTKEGKVYGFYTHRLVAAAFIGEIYEQVDHINSIKTDNKLENLRLCTKRENQLFHHKSEYAGITYSKATKKKWSAQISVNGKGRTLGYFHTKEEASARYWQEVEKLQREKQK